MYARQPARGRYGRRAIRRSRKARATKSSVIPLARLGGFRGCGCLLSYIFSGLLVMGDIQDHRVLGDAFWPNADFNHFLGMRRWLRMAHTDHTEWTIGNENNIATRRNARMDVCKALASRGVGVDCELISIDLHRSSAMAPIADFLRITNSPWSNA